MLTGRTFVGHGTHTDVVTASAEAYLDGVNRIIGARAVSEATAETRREPLVFKQREQVKVPV
jgi:hypothetical protein